MLNKSDRAREALEAIETRLRRLNPHDFTPINKRVVTEIPLPAADKSYHIASRQDLEGLATPPDDGGHISGSVKIANPDRFWSGSRFLIVIQG